MNKYTLKIDENSCWGCKSCEVACKQEHNTPNGVRLIYISEDGPKAVNGKLDFTYRANICKHCDDPPCREVCPVDAISKRDDSIVILNEDECTGCGSCIDACPHSAISFDEEKGVARKCNLCYFRIDNGLYPACADNVCLSHCIYFGEASQIEQMITEKPWLKKRIEQAKTELAKQVKQEARMGNKI